MYQIWIQIFEGDALVHEVQAVFDNAILTRAEAEKLAKSVDPSDYLTLREQSDYMYFVQKIVVVKV